MSPSRLPWMPLVHMLASAAPRIALLPQGQWHAIIFNFFISLPSFRWDLLTVQATPNAESSTSALNPWLVVVRSFNFSLLPYGWLCGDAYHHGGSYTLSYFFRLGWAFRPAGAAMSDQPPPFRFGCLAKLVRLTCRRLRQHVGASCTCCSAPSNTLFIFLTLCNY